MNTSAYITLIRLGVSSNATPQICLKKGMVLIGLVNFSINNLSHISLRVIVNRLIILGMIEYEYLAARSFKSVMKSIRAQNVLFQFGQE